MKPETTTFIILCTLLIQCSHTENTKWPQTKCSLNDSKWLTEQAQKTIKTFVNGIPELGIKKLDKLSIDPIFANYNNFIFNWTDVHAGGLKNAIIDDISINMELKTIRVLFHTDLLLEFYSDLDGVLMSVLPVYGSGRGDLTLKKMQMDMLFVFDIIKDDRGKDIVDIKSHYYGYNIGDRIISRLENLYNGDKKKSDVFHKIVNDNWRIMLHNFGSAFQKKISNSIFEAVKVYLRSRPLEEFALCN